MLYFYTHYFSILKLAHKVLCGCSDFVASFSAAVKRLRELLKVPNGSQEVKRGTSRVEGSS